MSAERVPSVAQREQAVEVLFETANILNGYRGAPDSTKYADVGDARVAVNTVTGLPIVGNTSGAHYYGFSLPFYKQNNLRWHHNIGNDFKGIIKRIVNVHVKTFRGDPQRQVCLQVAPLSSGVGEEWNEYYLERGWDEQLRHPFAQLFNAGTSVWVPLDSMGERKVYFPQTPEESTNATGRVQV